MKGYIGVTSREWFTYLANSKDVGEINFWRKNTGSFKVLMKGEPFFFLIKNERGVKGERAVLGKATYVRYEVLTVDDAWEEYGYSNGDANKESFIICMNTMFGKDTVNSEIGCIILTDFQVFDNPVYLSEIGIEFGNGIVSGKGINENEINAILDYGFIDNVLRMFKELNHLNLTEDDESFPEGKLRLKQHLVRERNPIVIKLAKERYLAKYGKLICEVCGFDFKARYGEIGEGYIEGHHTKPISEMDCDIFLVITNKRGERA